MIKFMKHYVTNGTDKARVHYSAFKMTTTGQNCVTLYAKDYSGDLSKIFSEGYEDNTDVMTDYFEKGRVRIIEGNPMYSAALARAQAA